MEASIRLEREQLYGGPLDGLDVSLPEGLPEFSVTAEPAASIGNGQWTYHRTVSWTADYRVIYCVPGNRKGGAK